MKSKRSQGTNPCVPVGPMHERFASVRLRGRGAAGHRHMKSGLMPARSHANSAPVRPKSTAISSASHFIGSQATPRCPGRRPRRCLRWSRLPLGMEASSLTARLWKRAPQAANGWPRARVPSFGFTGSRGNRPTTSSASTAGLTSAPAGVPRWCRPRGWSECASRSIALRRGPCIRPGDSLRVAP